MRDKVVLLVAILALGGLAAQAQCRSGYSATSGDTCSSDSAVQSAHVSLPHRGHTVQRQAAGEIECHGAVITWVDGEPVCQAETSSQPGPSRLLPVKAFWSGLGWFLGLETTNQ